MANLDTLQHITDTVSSGFHSIMPDVVNAVQNPADQTAIKTLIGGGLLYLIRLIIKSIANRRSNRH